jgi:hypothetical protein
MLGTRLDDHRTWGGITILPRGSRRFRYAPPFLLTSRPLTTTASRIVLENATRRVDDMTDDPRTAKIPTAASDWTKDTLDLLNVSYDRHNLSDFSFEGFNLPTDVLEGTPYFGSFNV